MNRCAIILVAICIVVLTTGISSAREKGLSGKKPFRELHEGELTGFIDPGLQGLKTSAAVDTFNIITFDFEIRDWQGWTQVDNTAQPDTFFHVDDFAGLGGGDYGGLYPLEGMKSMWCGARPDTDDLYLCGWEHLPGYGNSWEQSLVSDEFEFTGALSFSYKAHFDSEDGWDYTYVQYDRGDGDWVEIAAHDGIKSGTYSHELLLGLASTKLRFHFVSDGAWSDEDGLWNSDGACIVDSLVVYDSSGPIDYEDFESAAVDDQRADGDGNGLWWTAKLPEGYGLSSYLFAGLYQDKDPCGNNLSTQIVFFMGDAPHPSASYPGLFDTPFCKGPGGIGKPCQDETVWSPLISMIKYSTNNDVIQDADIPPEILPKLGGVLFKYTVYRDLPLANLVFYTWYIQNIYNGCPGQWLDRHFVLYGPDQDYIFSTNDVGDLVTADTIRVALSCMDLCLHWYLQYGNCAAHTPSPWFDNVRIQRYSTSGPQWSYRDLDLFQDQFPTGLGIESWVRIDAANDLNSTDNPLIRPGDSIVVSCTSPLGGGIAIEPDGWPKIYCHVRATYIGCASSCPGHVGSKPEYLFGPSLEGSYGRYVSDDGSMWTTMQCAQARVGPYPGTPVPDRYMVDLNDSLFTRGYMIEYYFSATDNNNETTYLPEDAPTRAERSLRSGGVTYEGVSYIFEITCLPLGCSDILYVDDFHGRGTFWGTVEQYFNPTILAVHPSTNWPERYDVMNPSSLVGNGLSRSATTTILTCYYRIIIWDSGNLDVGTIGDGSSESDKTNDCQLLVDYMTLYPDSVAGAGLWILGDNVAQDLSRLISPQALALLTTWCGVQPYPDPNWGSYYALTGGFPVGAVTPQITGTAAGIFYHTGTADQWYSFGGCPIINQFDCLDAATGATIAATYPDYGAHMNIGAAIANVTPNASGGPIRTMWFGHSFMYIRDTDGEAPIIRNHIMSDIIPWMNTPTNPVITETEVPKAYNLAQNFPNPFNPSTTISFDVKERGHVSLKIYNVAGQLVKTLVDETRDASSYSIPWDGTNNNGVTVASGVYFYKLNSKSFEQTKKMVLLR